MKTSSLWILFLFLPLLLGQCEDRQSPVSSQNPSPMEEHIRPHHRVPDSELSEVSDIINLDSGIKVAFFAPVQVEAVQSVDLIIHFHGGMKPVQWAVSQNARPYVLIHAHWGGGSSTYSRPIQKMGGQAFLFRILDSVANRISTAAIDNIILTSWSAGYGAIRQLIQDQDVVDSVAGIMLLDGLHCSYLPERKVLFEGGKLDSISLEPFVNWMRKSIDNQKVFLLTHSTIFPGTFASTTETADYLLRKAQMSRIPVLKEGPMGMQLISDVYKGKFKVLAYAGNTAPDHVDHYHAYWAFLELMKI